VRPSPIVQDTLVVEPNLLPEWRHIVVPLTFRGADLEIAIEPAAIEIGCRGEVPAKIAARTARGRGAELVAMPGCRYAAHRTSDGFGAWEEIRG
jgi:hypothetical protein